MKDRVKQILWEEIEAIAGRGQDLRKQWKKEIKELQEEYVAEVTEKSRLYWVFEMNGETWSGDWMAEEIVSHETDESAEGEVQEFADEFSRAWQSKITEIHEFIEEHTHFTVGYPDEYGETLEGEGILEQFELQVNYVPSNIESIDVTFENRVDIELHQLEQAADTP